jgi:hypothetical protein
VKKMKSCPAGKVRRNNRCVISPEFKQSEIEEIKRELKSGKNVNDVVEEWTNYVLEENLDINQREESELVTEVGRQIRTLAKRRR